jgi:ankyrin repeat protein
MRFIQISSLIVVLILMTGMLGAQTPEAAMMDATRQGDLEALGSLLANRTDPDATEPDGSRALHWAVYRDNVDAVRLLIEAGATPTVKNREGASPMYLAATNGNAEIIEILLDAGEDANAIVTAEGESALMLASLTGNDRAVRILLERGADVNHVQERGQTALMWAASEGHADVLEILIEHRATLGLRSIESTLDERRPPGALSALHFAARHGDLDSVRVLAEAGADLNPAMAEGTTPIIMAIVNGHYELALYLLNHGADANLTDQYNRGPLYATIDMRNVQWAQGSAPTGDNLDPLELIKALLAQGADPNAALVEVVHNRGAFDMRWSESVGATPFVRAAQNGDITVLNLLLAYGANPFHASKVEETALHLLGGVGWPLGQGHIRTDEEILASYQLLVDLGLDVNAGNASGITPLMGAAYKGENLAVRWLVDHGADLSATDDEGRTALNWAEGVLATLAQPLRRQPHTEVLLRELMRLDAAP